MDAREMMRYANERHNEEPKQATTNYLVRLTHVDVYAGANFKWLESPLFAIKFASIESAEAYAITTLQLKASEYVIAEA